MSKEYAINCDKIIFSFHFFAILGLDLFQCILIVVAGSFIKSALKERTMGPSSLRDSIALREQSNINNCLTA